MERHKHKLFRRGAAQGGPWSEAPEAHGFIQQKG